MSATREVLSSHGTKGFLAPIGILGFLVLWSGLSYSGLVDSLVLPPPDRVWGSINDIGPPLFSHFIATLVRVLAGYMSAAVLGTLLGIVMQYSRVWYGILDGLIESWRPVPPVALVPFFILLFGFSELGRFLLVVLGTTLVVTVTVVEALDRVDPALIQLGLVFGLSRRELFRSILVPAMLPHAKAGFRIALALSLTLVVVSEFLGSEFGLGYLVSVAKVTLTTPTIFLCIILLGLIGFVLDSLVRITFDLLSRWEFSAKEAIR